MRENGAHYGVINDTCYIRLAVTGNWTHYGIINHIHQIAREIWGGGERGYTVMVHIILILYISHSATMRGKRGTVWCYE